MSRAATGTTPYVLRDAAYPLSRAWYERFWSADQSSRRHDPALMRSDETGRMILELQRYCRGERDGVSILVAGQRGAGKTTLVKLALQEVMEANAGLIPLPIFLHGPTIIDQDANTLPANGRDSAQGKQGAIAANGPASANDPKAASDKESASDPTSAKVEDSKWSKELALPQIITVLYRDVSRVIYRAWLNALQESPYGRRAERELFELRTQLDLSLDSAPDAVTLRRIWARAGFLHSGVAPYLSPMRWSAFDGRWVRQLQPPPIAGPKDDQGLREILALVSCADAYRVVLGDTKERQERKSFDERRQQSPPLAPPSPPRDAAPKSGEESKRKSTTEKLAPAALAATTGSLTLLSDGIQNGGFGRLALAVAVGAVVWLVTWLAASHGTHRQSRQEVRRDRTTDIKWDTSRIERDFPKLLKRVKDAGFAPIFVLDELDKMSNAKKKLEDFLLLSKHLVTDDAAFLFLTNRNYYETLITNERRTVEELLGGDKPPRRSNGAARRPGGGNSSNLTAKTFFTYRIFVRYSPKNFRQFLLDSISDEDWPHDEGEVDSQRRRNRLGLLAWGTILIYRARMLPFDFDRRLKLMIGPKGTFEHDAQSAFGPAGQRQEITMQLGIELVAGEPAVQERMTELPYYSQYVYDALYFVAELHTVGRSDADTNEPFRITPELLRRYLWSRAQGEEEEPPKNFIPPDDTNFLFGLVQRYVQLLENPRLIREGILRYADSDEVTEADRPLWRDLAQHAVSEWPIVKVESHA